MIRSLAYILLDGFRVSVLISIQNHADWNAPAMDAGNLSLFLLHI